MIFLSYVKIICAHAGNYFVDMDIGGGKRMKMEELAQLTKETIIQILEILRLDQRTIDAFWFLAVEEAYGLERAVEFDTILMFGKI